MKESKSGSSSGTVVNEIKRPSKYGVKFKRKNVLILLLAGLVCLLTFGYIAYSSKPTENLSYVEVLETANQLMNEKRYDEAYEILETNKDKEAFVNNLEFYVLISRAAFLSGNIDQAKKFAILGAEIYKNSNPKNPAYGYILQAVSSGTYVDNPYEQNQGGSQPVPKEQVDDPDFQG